MRRSQLTVLHAGFWNGETIVHSRDEVGKNLPADAGHFQPHPERWPAPRCHHHYKDTSSLRTRTARRAMWMLNTGAGSVRNRQGHNQPQEYERVTCCQFLSVFHLTGSKTRVHTSTPLQTYSSGEPLQSHVSSRSLIALPPHRRLRRNVTTWYPPCKKLQLTRSRTGDGRC